MNTNSDAAAVRVERVPLRALEQGWDAEVRPQDVALVEPVLQVMRELSRFRMPGLGLMASMRDNTNIAEEPLYFIKRCDPEHFYTVSVLYPLGILFTKQRLDAITAMLPLYIHSDHVEWGNDPNEDWRPFLNVRVCFAEYPNSFEARYLLMTTAHHVQQTALVHGASDAGGVAVRRMRDATFISNSTSQRATKRVRTESETVNNSSSNNNNNNNNFTNDGPGF